MRPRLHEHSGQYQHDEEDHRGNVRTTLPAASGHLVVSDCAFTAAITAITATAERILTAEAGFSDVTFDDDAARDGITLQKSS